MTHKETPGYNRKQNKRQKKPDKMQMNVAGLRRNIKNLAHNYSDAQVCTN